MAALALAVAVAWSAPTTADDSTAATSVRSRSVAANPPGARRNAKLKWLPYRPSKPRDGQAARAEQESRTTRNKHADRNVMPVAHVATAQWVAQIPTQRPAASSPFKDPFGDGQSVPQPHLAEPELSRNVPAEENAGPLLTGSQLPTVQQQPAVTPQVESAEVDVDRALGAGLQDGSPKGTAGSPLAEQDWTEHQVVPKQCPSPNDKDLYTPIGELTTDISVKPDRDQAVDVEEPGKCVLSDKTLDPHTLRNWSPTTFTWKASGLCHKPLYFEDVQLERYGHSHGPYLQPIISGAHFFLSIPALPYYMGVYPPGECIYTLGYYRPGSCAPYMVEPFPLSFRGALAAGGIWTGAAFVIP